MLPLQETPPLEVRIRPCLNPDAPVTTALEPTYHSILGAFREAVKSGYGSCLGAACRDESQALASALDSPCRLNRSQLCRLLRRDQSRGTKGRFARSQTVANLRQAHTLAIGAGSQLGPRKMGLPRLPMSRRRLRTAREICSPRLSSSFGLGRLPPGHRHQNRSVLLTCRPNGGLLRLDVIRIQPILIAQVEPAVRDHR